MAQRELPVPIYVTRGEGQRLDNARTLHGEPGGGTAGRAGCAAGGGASAHRLAFPSDPVRLRGGPPRLQPLPGGQREPGLPVVQPRPAHLPLRAAVPAGGRGAAVSRTQHQRGEPPALPHGPASHSSAIPHRGLPGPALPPTVSALPGSAQPCPRPPTLSSCVPPRSGRLARHLPTPHRRSRLGASHHHPSLLQIEPLTGPPEGGLALTILGSNLGRDFADVQDAVSVAGRPCSPDPSLYRISAR